MARNYWPLILTGFLSLLTQRFEALGANAEFSEPDLRAALDLSAVKKLISTNCSFDLKVTRWAYEGTDREHMFERVNEIMSTNRVFSQNNDTSIASAADTERKIVALFRPAEPSLWSVKLYNDYIKFSRSISESAKSKFAAEGISNTGIRDWLFAPGTIYRYDKEGKTVDIRPAIPKREPYPLPLDVVDLSFGLLSPGANFLSISATKHTDGNTVTLSAVKKAKVELSIITGNRRIAPVLLTVSRLNGDIATRRIYSNYITLPALPWCPAASQIVMTYGHSDVDVQLYTLTAFSLKSVSEGDVSLQVSAESRFNDDSGVLNPVSTPTPH